MRNPSGFLGDLMNTPGWLPERRREEICAAWAGGLADALSSHRRLHAERLRKRKQLSGLDGALDTPAWTTISTTHSSCGWRLILGLKTSPCRYRSRDPRGLGCLNCGFYAGATARTASSDEILNQFVNGVRRGFDSHRRFDVIEFLGDGSFLDDTQLTPATRARLFDRIAKMQFVQRVLIEAPPQEVIAQAEVIDDLRRRLRGDQMLEIGIGLETADDFIRAACINKEFSRATVEAAVDLVAAAESEERAGIGLVFYLLVKPAFLTSNEAIEDVHKTLRYLDELGRRTGLPLVAKLEPAAIADGTVLSYLFALGPGHPQWYAPLDYWSILEILVKAGSDPECRDVFQRLRIGAREDMDDVLYVPGIYREDGRLDQFDFVLYDSIQRFNVHHDLGILLETLNAVYPDNLPDLLGSRSSLSRWRESLQDGHDREEGLEALPACVSAIRVSRSRPQGISEAPDGLFVPYKFLRQLYGALDLFEGYLPESASILENLRHLGSVRSGSLSTREMAQVVSVFSECLLRQGIDFHRVDGREVTVDNEGRLRAFLEVTDLLHAEVYPIWSVIPLRDDGFRSG